MLRGAEARSCVLLGSSNSGGPGLLPPSSDDKKGARGEEEGERGEEEGEKEGRVGGRG